MLRRRTDIVETLLEEAVRDDDATLLNIILKQCWNKEKIFSQVNQDGDNLLHEICRKNNTNSARVFIENGIDVNVRNSQGNTGLHFATLNSNTLLMNLLFEAGVNPFIENKDGKQAFELTNCKVTRERLRQYSIKCSELKLLQNLAAWKRIVKDEVERDREIAIKEKEFEQNRRLSYQCVTPDTKPLQRADSGIISDAESDKSIDQLVATIPSYTLMFGHNTKARGNRSHSVREAGNAQRVNCGTKDDDNKHDSKPKGHNLKVSSLYANIRKTPINRRRKFIRNQRMSMPELSLMDSPESYI